MEPQNAPVKGSQKPTSLRVLDGQTELAEEDLIRVGEFFNRWGREILIIAGVVAAIFLVTKFLREADENQRKIASSKFEETRATLTELKSAMAAKASVSGEAASAKAQEIEGIKTKYAEQIKVLRDAKEPYKSLADIYQALGFNATGDVAGAKASLASLNLAQTLTTSDDTLFIELGALNLARALIDSTDSFNEGFAALVTLVEKGKFVATNAAIALAEVAQTADDKSKAKAALEGLVTRVPESQEVLKASLKRLS